MINIAQKTLDFRRRSFLLLFSLLMPTFSLPYCPANLTVHLQPAWNAPLPLHTESKASVIYLVPIIFGAESLDQ